MVGYWGLGWGIGFGWEVGWQHTSPSIDSSTPIISSSEARTMRLDECDWDSISTFRPSWGSSQGFGLGCLGLGEASSTF